MVQGIGGTNSNSGSIKHLNIYKQFYSEYQKYLKDTQDSISFEAWMRYKNKLSDFTQAIENYLETGNEYRGDGIDNNTLSDSMHISSANGAIYQSPDEETFYQFDYENGTYTVLHGNEELARALGFGDDTNIDTINIGYKSATATDYTFGNLDDGQDTTTQYLVSGYGNVAYVQQEFDIHYIFNALLMNPNDPQFQIAQGILKDLADNISQWLPQSEIDNLNAIADQYGNESAEYKAEAKRLMLAYLDQANEWIEDHAHVEYTQESNFSTGDSSVNGSDSTQGSDSVNGSDSDESENSVPQYDKSSVLDKAGLLADYTNNTNWKSEKVNRKGKTQDEARNQAFALANAKAQEILNSLENSLIAQLGDQCTDEIKKYISQAKQAALSDTGLWREYHWYSNGALNKNKGFTSNVNYKPLIDKFFSEFDTLCQNNGKTSAEVQAEKDAEAAKAAQEKAGYQALWELDINEAADEAGVDDVTAVPTGNNQFAEIQEKAQNDILKPLIAKIREKMAGKGIPDSDLETILNEAADAAVANPNNWASTSNNYTYLIDEDKLTDIFNQNIKKAIKARGYEF